MTWDAHLETATLHVPLGPPIVASIGALVALVAALRTARDEPARRRMTLTGLLPIACTLLVDLPFAWVPGTGAMVAAGLLPALVGGVSAGRVLDASRGGLVAVVAVIGGLLAQVSLLQTDAILRFGDAPAFVLPEPGIVQVGRRATVVPAAKRSGGERALWFRHGTRWTPRPITVEGKKPGPNEVTFLADEEGGSGLSIAAPGAVRVAAERGDARLPLRVGNRFRYHVETLHRHGGLAGSLAGPSMSAITQEMWVAGVGEIMNGGVRVFRLAVGDEKRPQIEVYAADGQLFEAGKFKPLPLFEKASSPADFAFALLGEGCSCAAIGPLAGPTECKQRRDASLIDRLAVPIFTLGILGADDHEIAWILDDTTRGPDDAPSIDDVTPFAACAPPRPGLPVIGPGDDHAPAARPTQAENAAAAPSWARPDGAVPWTESEATFEAANAILAPRDAALLACHARYEANPDGFLDKGPDLDVTLRIGAAPEVTRRGPWDTRSAYVTVPVALRGGERIFAHFVDRNTLGEDQDLGLVSATVGDALPVNAIDGPRSIECRGLASDAIEAALRASLARADTALEGVARDLRPTLADEGFGLDFSLRDGRHAIADAASLVGFADPRVSRRLAWERRIEEVFAVLAEPLARSLAEKKREEGVWSEPGETPIVLRAEGFVCGADLLRVYAEADATWANGALSRFGCALRVTAENRADGDRWLHMGDAPRMGPLPWLSIGGGKTRLLRLIDLTIGRERRGDAYRKLPAHGKGTLLFVPQGPVDPASDSMLLVIGADPVVLAVPPRAGQKGRGL